MLRDNLAGLIEPMIDCAGVHLLSGHHKAGQTGGCSRSTELAIVARKRPWRQIFGWQTGRRAENGKCLGLEVTIAAHDSRAVGTAQHQSHRTIDPPCLRKSPPRRGGIFALTENVSSPFHAEPRHLWVSSVRNENPDPSRGNYKGVGDRQSDATGEPLDHAPFVDVADCRRVAAAAVRASCKVRYSSAAHGRNECRYRTRPDKRCSAAVEARALAC
jgi:hypothetical protein